MKNKSYDNIQSISLIIQSFLESELDIHTGNMELFIVSEKIIKLLRAEFYNEGLRDAIKATQAKLSEIIEKIEELEAYEN